MIIVTVDDMFYVLEGRSRAAFRVYDLFGLVINYIKNKNLWISSYNIVSNLIKDIKEALYCVGGEYSEHLTF